MNNTPHLSLESSLRALSEEISQGRRLTVDEALTLAENAPPPELFALADQLRRHFQGDRADFCSIVNARSGRCSEDCAFCAQSSRHHTGAVCYEQLDAETILALAKENEAAGVTRFSLVTAGRNLTDNQIEYFAALFVHLGHETQLSLCASMGFLTPEQATRLRTAGVSRYHCNLETSESFFSEICTSHSFNEKKETLRIARDAGMSLCSGGIIGMGESRRQRFELAVSLRQLAVDSIPLNILDPIPGTPLAHQSPLDADEIILTIAMFRILHPDATLRTAGGRAQLGSRQADCFRAGAGGAIVGNYLTTLGRNIASDRAMFAELGFSL
ncbi:MAG: biotin synthase BioB [Desulfobulbaceae bacterium]|jgi:biotin synthase|nr:biotin synthase BioB [Desulfobulbaceae bacterium]